MDLRFPVADRSPAAWPQVTIGDATAPGPFRPVDETPDEPPGIEKAQDAAFSNSRAAVLRPADELVGSTVKTMLAIYRAKYGLDFGTIVFQAHKQKAAEVRAWCNNMDPGECGLLLAGTSRGIHTFVLVVGRSHDGRPRCLIVDSAGPCMASVRLALQKEFDGQVFITPKIQGTAECGCMVFAMRFLLMSRCADLGARALETMELFEQQGAREGDRQLQVDDMIPLAGWLAATRHRQVVELSDILPALPLYNGGRHTGCTLEQFFHQRAATLVPELRRMYDDVDLMIRSPTTDQVPETRRTYLQNRFVRHSPTQAERTD